MRTGEFQTQTIYRLQWMQTNGRTRSRLFARKASAQRKADKMRAEGRDPLIEVCLLIRPGPDGYPAAPVGDNSDRGPESHDTDWPEPEKMRAKYPDDYTYEWFRNTGWMPDGVNKAVEYGFEGGAVPLTVFKRRVKDEYAYAEVIEYFLSFPEYYEVRPPTETDPGHVRLVGQPTPTTRIYP